MKLRKTLSTLLAAALMVGLLCIPSMAASPVKVTNGYAPYNTVSLSSAVNEGTALLGIYHSEKLATPVRVYTVQAGSTLTVTGAYFVQAHPVTLLPDGTYELKPVRRDLGLQGDVTAPNGDSVLATSNDWRLWTGYPVVSTGASCSMVLTNSQVGTWSLNGYDVILKVLPMEVPQDTRIAVYEVSSSSVNVRAGAGTYFASVGTLAGGTRVNVYTRSSDGCWGNVVSLTPACSCNQDTVDGYHINNLGWIHLDNARFIGYKTLCGSIPRQHRVWAAANTYRVTANTLAIHDGPHDQHEVVGTLSRETLIDVTEFFGEDWGYLANGQGWVRLGYSGNYQNVQYAAIKTITTDNNVTPNTVKITAAPGEGVLARLTIKWNAGLIPVRSGISDVTSNVPNDGAGTVTGIAQNSPVIGYLAHQHNGQKIDLVNVQNDWGQLPSVNGQPGGWIYLPEIGTLEQGDI